MFPIPATRALHITSNRLPMIEKTFALFLRDGTRLAMRFEGNAESAYAAAKAQGLDIIAVAELPPPAAMAAEARGATCHDVVVKYSADGETVKVGTFCS